MRTSVRTGLAVCLLFALAACGASPETKKARHFENGDKFFEQKQFKEAAIEYANVLKLDGNNKTAYKKLALVFSTTGEPARELAFLLKAKSVDPEDIELRLRIARLNLMFDKARDCREDVEFVLGKDPQNMEGLSLLAESSRSPDEISDAISRLTAFSPAPADAPKHNVALGQLYLKKGDFTKAEKSFFDALTGESNLMEAHLGLGDLAAIRKDFGQAEQEYKAAADLVPGVSTVHMRLSDFYLFMGNPAQAKQVLENALQRAPDFSPALYRLARIALAEQNFDECSKLVDKLLEKNPADLDGQGLRAQLLLARNEPVEAEKILLEINNARPDLPLPKFLLGLAYMGKGDLANARTFLKRAVDQEPNLTEAALRLAEVNIRTAFFQPANEILNKILDRDRGNLEAISLLPDSVRTGPEIKAAIKRLEPLQFQFGDNPKFNLALASLYLKNNDLKKSEEILNRVTSKDANSVQGHSFLANLFLRKGDFGQAEKEFAKAAELAPPPSGSQIVLAEFYYTQKRTAEAKKMLEDILAKSPDYFPASFTLGRIAFEERDFAEANKQLETVLKLSPTHLDAQILKGQTNLALNKATEALQDFGEVLKINPGAVNVLYLAGLAHLQLRDFPSARSSFNEAIKLQPDFPDPRMRLAELDLDARAFQPALSNLEFLREKGLKDPSLNLLLGTAYLGKNEPKKANAFLQDYAKTNPDDFRGKALLCASINALGKKNEAVKCFEDLLKSSPDSIDPLSQLVSIDISDKNPDSALRRVKNQIESSGQKPELYELLGRVHFVRKEFDEAEKAFLKAIELNPGSGQYDVELIQIYIAGNKNDKAASRIEEAIKRDPKNISLLMLAGPFYQQAKNIPKAREAYEAILAIKPDYAPAANNLAYLYCEYLGDIEKALRLARTARDISPEDPSIADTLGWILYKKGNFDWALGFLQESVAKMPDNAEVQFHLGMTHYQLGNFEQAEKALRLALQMMPEMSEAGEAKKALAEMQAQKTEVK